jgi:hypothetical protein
MKILIKRLKKLEAATAALINGPCLWPARAAAVRERTVNSMSLEEQALLTESFGSQGTVGLGEFAAMHPAVWSRYNEAFDRAVREVPAPCAMCTADLRGCW